MPLPRGWEVTKESENEKYDIITELASRLPE